MRYEVTVQGGVMMLGKRTRFLTMMAAALGIPYAWFNENFSGPLQNTWSSLKGTASAVASKQSSDLGPARAWTLPGFTTETAATVVNRSAALAPSIHDLAESLRFDVNQRWVVDHWGRVSTVRAEQDLEGLRVPLVTGTNLDDIAGSLTYYFDRQHCVRRITLHGQTGDERTLVAIATKYFGMRAEPSLGPGAYMNRWNATPMNALRISHAPVIRLDAPNTRLIIDLELNDLRAGYGLSAEFTQLLQGDQHIRRWGV